MKKFKAQVATGVILIIGGTLVFLTDYIKEKRDVVFSEMNLTLSSIMLDNKLNNSNNNETEDTIDNTEDEEEQIDNSYTYEEYLSHLKETETFSKKNHNYKLNKLAYFTFKNITVTIVNKKFVIISKEENPTIHFIIRHPKLVNAISNFKPIVKEAN